MTLSRTGATLAAFPLALAAVAWAGTHPVVETPALSETTVSLDGMSERPKPTTTRSTGTAKFTWTQTSPISYRIEVNSLSGVPTGAHIHGPADREGTAPPIVVFKLDSVIAHGTIAIGSIDSSMVKVSLDSLKELIDDGMAYVNVHTAKYPDGEIRGQFKGGS
jgi:hypothetical protein